MLVSLYEVAHARAGDKGTLNTVSVIPYDKGWYPVLREKLTAARVHAHLSDRYSGGVTRHEMPNIQALVFVCRRAAEDSVTTSLYLDAHAKSLSSELLELTLEVDELPS